MEDKHCGCKFSSYWQNRAYERHLSRVIIVINNYLLLFYVLLITQNLFIYVLLLTHYIRVQKEG